MSAELPDPIAENIPDFTGRTWLLPGLLAWLEQPSQRIFLLTGGPGTGKSMITAWLAGAGPAPSDATAQAQLAQIRSQVAAVHFCMAATRNYGPRIAAENIANQLTQNIKPFGAALVSTLAERVQITVNQQVGSVSDGSVTGVSIARLDLGTLDDETGFDHAFIQPLKKMYADGYDQPLLLLIDALDEAQTYTGSINLVQLLAKLADLPDKVHLLLTTRSDPRVLKYFRDAPGIDLIADAPAGAADVQSYAAGRLAKEAPDLESEKRDLLAARIGTMAQGVFQYAHMVVSDILSHPANSADLENYPLPAGLSKLYHSFLNRELGTDEDRWFETFRPLLGLISVSRGAGLSRTQLSRLIGKEIDQPLRACKQYLAGDLPEGPFRSFDRSFIDFLLEDDENQDYHIDAQAMNRRLSDYYLQNFAQNWSGCDAYGIHHLVEHTLAAGLTALERKDAFNLILKDEFINAIVERTGWLYDFIEDLEALAKEEPAWVAKLCFKLILDRPPNSLVIQHALQLLVKLLPSTGPAGDPALPREESLNQIIRILSDPAADIPQRLMESLEHESDERVRGVIGLALAETRDPQVAACLVEMFKKEFGEASWAAADALISLNQRAVIPELVAWYLELQNKKDRRSCARKQRILYVLGWMHAEEAQVLKPDAFNASDPKIIGRAVDLTCLLQPIKEDEIYLLKQVQRILASSPAQPQALGPWADEWLQKRLVRAIQRRHVADALANLRRLQEHIRSRPAPPPAKRGVDRAELGAAKRARLVEAVGEAITELQIGR